MTLILELNDEQEQKLRSAARLLGLNAEEYARLLVDRFTEEDQDEAWLADLDTLTEGSGTLPVLSEDATTREHIYGSRG